MNRKDLQARFVETVLSSGIVAPGSVIVAGVSGGADSVALVHLLARAKTSGAIALDLHLAHLNHGLRDEAAADAAFVEELAQRLRLPLVCETVNVRELAAAQSLSIEEAGRNARMAFFERVALRVGASHVALGHHADDNVETVLHRIARGTGLRGLAGIPPVRQLRPGSDIQLIRPLLPFRREEIRAFLEVEGIAWREDASNAADTYTRNRIRHQVLPVLALVAPEPSSAILRLIEQARDMTEYLEDVAGRALESLMLEHGSGRLVLDARTLARKHRAIASQVVLLALRGVQAPEGDLSAAHVGMVLDLLVHLAGSQELDLPGGVRVTREYDRLTFERIDGREASAEGWSPCVIALNGVTVLPELGLEVQVEERPLTPEERSACLAGRVDRAEAEEWVDAERVTLPLIARSWQPGDRFTPLGAGGQKKVSDFLTDAKVPQEQRRRTVVLCDQAGPVWLVPLRIDDRVRVTDATRRVLRLRVRSLAGDA